MTSNGDHEGMSQVLAEFVASLELGSVPNSVRHAGRRTVANAVSLSVGASAHPAIRSTLRALDQLGAGDGLRSDEGASVMGTGQRLPVPDAALVNGMGVHVEDFDDTHLATVVHPGAPVVPAAVAMAELCKASGADVLEGVIAGTEVAIRVGLALGNDHFDRGWHLTGTAGHVGAAAAAARVAGLDARRTLAALAIGTTQAAGLQEALGTMVKCFHAGKAASDGVEAAILAAEGFQAPTEPLEGRRGLLALTTSSPDAGRSVVDLGTVWEIESNAFKPYACGIVSHPVIDAGVALGHEFGRDPSVVEAVEVTVNPIVLDVMGVRRPRNGLQSKFSVYHCFAVGYLDGVAGPVQFGDARAMAPDAVAVRDRVSVVCDPTIRRDECHAVVRTSTGIQSYHVEHATGSAASPMTDDQLRSKAVLVAGPVLTDGAAGSLFDAALTIDALTTAGDLTRLATQATVPM